MKKIIGSGITTLQISLEEMDIAMKRVKRKGKEEKTKNGFLRMLLGPWGARLLGTIVNWAGDEVFRSRQDF